MIHFSRDYFISDCENCIFMRPAVCTMTNYEIYTQFTNLQMACLPITPKKEPKTRLTDDFVCRNFQSFVEHYMPCKPIRKQEKKNLVMSAPI